jgi:hypothetical protein
MMQVTYSYIDLGLMSDRMLLLFGLMLGVIGHLPAILRRSTNTDVPARPGKGQVNGVLVTETPEVQVGILARALVSPPRAANARQQPRWSHPKSSGWGQGEGVAAWRRASRPLSPEEATDPVLKGSSQRPSQWSDSAEES